MGRDNNFKNMITLITPTGGRPEAFKLCEKWIKNQTYKGDMEWIVIHDLPEEKLNTTMGQKIMLAPTSWKPHINTQRENMREALKHVRGDIILFIEDDDYYAPKYIETMVTLLKTSEIAGLSNSRYYHVGVPGFKRMNNYAHASLSQTAIRKSMLGRLSRAVESGHFYFDIELWKYCKEDCIPLSLVANSPAATGIKGMPGRAGLSGGHDKNWYEEDIGLEVLKGWLGKDAQEYMKFISHEKK